MGFDAPPMQINSAIKAVPRTLPEAIIPSLASSWMEEAFCMGAWGGCGTGADGGCGPMRTCEMGVHELVVAWAFMG